MVSLNHGYFGYLPTPRHHELGGYETWLGTNRLEVEASDKMLAALLEMSGEMDVKLKPEVRERCLKVLREGLKSDEFWPAMHAAEALTYAGQTEEVLAALAKRTAADDQQRCGLAREAVRAGDAEKAMMLLAILADEKSIGRVHAAESLFKVNQIGDGKALKAAAAQDENLKLKLMAAAALARAGDAPSLLAIRKHLNHDDVEVRKIAVWILGQIGAQPIFPRFASRSPVSRTTWPARMAPTPWLASAMPMPFSNSRPIWTRRIPSCERIRQTLPAMRGRCRREAS